MLAEVLAAVSLSMMILHLATRAARAASAAWFLFSAACFTKIPDFIAGHDYYNVGVFAAAAVFFLLLALASQHGGDTIYYTTRFSAMACAVYFPFAFTPLGELLIAKTAFLTAILGNALGFPMEANGNTIELNDRSVEIILACTAIESMSLFAGATLGVKAAKLRRLAAFLVSVPTIYALNLFRNVFVTVSYAYSWFGEDSFYIAHHIIAKILSTLALVVIAYVVFRILPELLELITSLKDEIAATVFSRRSRLER